MVMMRMFIFGLSFVYLWQVQFMPEGKISIFESEFNSGSAENPYQTTAKTSSSSPYLEITILLCKYGHPYLPTYHKSFCPNFFFGKSMAGGYPTYLQFGHMSKLSYF